MDLLILLSIILSVLLGVGRAVDLALFTDPASGLCTAGSVWLRYAALAIALAAAYLHDELGVAENEAVVVCPVDPYVDNTYYEAVKTPAGTCRTGWC